VARLLSSRGEWQVLARAETLPTTALLLTIHTASGSWAIPSAAVGSVEPFDAASDEAALDVLALLGAPAAPTSEAPRVIVLQVAGERLRLLVRGALRLSETTAQSLLPLPAALTHVSPFVTHVALVDAKPALFVVSPERLLRAFQADQRSFPSTLTTSPEARSC
jgi:hypothetical protein